MPENELFSSMAIISFTDPNLFQFELITLV